MADSSERHSGGDLRSGIGAEAPARTSGDADQYQRAHARRVGLSWQFSFLLLVVLTQFAARGEDAACTYPVDSAAYAMATFAEVSACLKAGAEPTRAALSVAAADNADAAVMRALLGAGGDANGRRPGSGLTPLHTAAARNANADVSKALIDAGADPNALDNDRWTPLHFAAERNANPAVTETLLAGGADHSAKEVNGYSPLHAAAAFNSAGVVAVLIEAGADMTARNRDGRTPLHLAVRNKDPGAVVRVFLESGVNPNLRDQRGSTPLHWAMAIDDPTAREALIAGGADQDVKNLDGLTPADIKAEADRKRRPRVRTVELPAPKVP